MFQNNAFKIETERLILRCYELSDAEALKETVDSNLDHLREFMSWSREEPQSIEKKRDLLRGFIAKFYGNEDYVYGAFLKSGELIGGTGFHLRRGEGILEIGYWISQKHINKGFATELSYALTKVAFKHVGVEKVEIRNDVANLASKRIPEKLGFRLDCVETDLSKNEDGSRSKNNIYCMFKEDFKIISKYEPVKAFDGVGNLLKENV